jgi:hypothetical protein
LGTVVNNPIGHLFWNFCFYFRQITMLIGLMTGAPGESQFLLEDASDFKKKLNFSSPTLRICVQIARVVETESYLFLGKRIIAPSPATSIKTSGAANEENARV